MKKLFVVLWLLLMAGMALAQCPVKSASEKIVKPLICLDTLGRSVTPDSAHITTYKDDATYATYFARSTTFPFTAASIDTTRPPIGGTAPVLYWLSETISNIDGTASNATLAINVQLWWKGYATDNMYCVQMVSDSLNDVVWKLAALTAGPLEPTTAGRKLDVNAGGEAGLDFDNTSGTLAKTTDITGFNDIAATAIVSSGAITTSGGAVSTVTTTTNLTTNNDKTGYALTSSYPDSAGISRIQRRMWGVQLGASGSSDSLTAAQRQSALSPSGARLGVNTLELNGTSQTARDIGASVLLSSGTGTGQLSISSGTVTVGTNNDKTGYALTTSYPDSAGLSRILGRKLFGIAAGTGSDSLTKEQRITGASPALDSINTFTYAPDLVDLIWDEDSTGHYTSPNMAYTAAQTGSSTGADSGVVSRIVKRHVGGIQLGTSGSSDSLTLAQRQAAMSPSGSPLNANTTQLSGDGTAADNSELFFDGTGYAGTNNVIPTVTTLTNKTGFSLASTGSDADTGIVALKTKLTTIAGYTDDIGTAGAGLTSVRLGARGTDSDTGFIAMKTKITTITTHTTEMHDSLDTQGWAATGSGGGGTADVYPLSGIKFLVDAVGADGNSQFVSDTASLGAYSSNENTLINRAVIIRSLTDGEVQIPTTITRVAYTGANCSLSVSIDAPKNFAANDTIQLLGLPWHDFATLGEAAAVQRDTILKTDSTLYGGEANIGGAIVDGGGGSDSTEIKTMLQNNQVLDAADSTMKMAQTTTGAGSLRRGEVGSLANAADSVSNRLQNPGVNVTKIKGSTTLVIDTSRNATGLASGSSGGCPDSGGFAVTVFFLDSSDANEPVYDATVRTKSSLAGVVTGKASTGINGSFTFSMNAGKHYILTQAYGMTFPVDSITVTDDVVDTVYGYARARVPGMTTVFGRLISTGGAALAGASVELELTNYDDTLLYVAGGEQVVPVVSKATVDANGDWAVPVYANSAFDAKSRYILRVRHPEATFVPRLLHAVPDTTSINVKDLY